jgi:imidazolonepropionase-like amidohydrolase
MLAYQASDAMPRAYHHRADVQAERFTHGDNPAVEAVLQDMKQRGTILDATVWVYAKMEEGHAAHPQSPAPYCSAELAAQLTHEAWRDGVAISAGTDGFSAPDDPWPALYQELELLQDKAHLPPAAVLRAATLNGALTFHGADEQGSIAPGKLADLVFTREDPLQTVRALRTTVLTVKRGAQYWRKDFTPSPDERLGDDD